MPREAVNIIDTHKLNAMQAVCDCARIWSRSTGDDKARAEQALLCALATWENIEVGESNP